MKRLPGIIILLIVPLGLFAQPIDFFEMPFNYNPFLYPERQYTTNPAIAAQLSRPIDEIDAYFAADRDASREELTGAQGVLTESFFSTVAVAAFTRFTREDDAVTRLSGTLIPDLFFTREKDAQYSTPGQTVTVTNRDYWLYTFGSYLSARADGDSAMGFAGNLGVIVDPVREEFERTTDTAQNAGAQFYSAPGGPIARVLTIFPSATFGVTSDADGEWKALGSRIGVGLTDRSARFRSADTDASGFDDSIVSEEAFQTNATWGNGQAYYDYKDQTPSARVSVYPALIRPMDDGRDLILSGRLDLVDGSRRVTYTRTGTADENRNIVTTGSLLSSGGVFAGVRGTTDFGAETRYGFLVDLDVNLRGERDFDAVGASTYDPLNTNRLRQSADTDPDNGEVITLADASDLSVDSELGFLAGLEWRIGAPVVLYMTGSATVNTDYRRYRYFDTTTNVVWTEWTARNDLALNLGSSFGIQFTVPDGPFITVSGSLPSLFFAGAGDNYITFDPMPSSPAGDSPGIADDKVTFSGQGFTVNVNVTVRR